MRRHSPAAVVACAGAGERGAPGGTLVTIILIPAAPGASMRMPSRHASTRATSFLVSAVAVTAVAGCSGAAAAEQGVQVVASTNVYGDLVRTVGGDRVEV